MTKDKHTHQYKTSVTKTIPLGKYVFDSGEVRYVAMTAKDTLKQRKCKCGRLLTYDLERTKV